MLRHACGYALANKGLDTRTLQAYLGHRSINSTTRYAALAPGRFKNIWGRVWGLGKACRGACVGPLQGLLAGLKCGWAAHRMADQWPSVESDASKSPKVGIKRRIKARAFVGSLSFAGSTKGMSE
jgi:hypothetical protein